MGPGILLAPRVVQRRSHIGCSCPRSSGNRGPREPAPHSWEAEVSFNDGQFVSAVFYGSAIAASALGQEQASTTPSTAEPGKIGVPETVFRPQDQASPCGLQRSAAPSDSPNVLLI